MVELKLFCAVVGARASAFEVKIGNTESVSALNKAIKSKKMYQFPADELQLFLAKTEGGAWLPVDDDLNKMLLQNRVDTSNLQELRPTWKLNRGKNPQLFGPNTPLGEDVGHVLVVELAEKQSATSQRSEIEDQRLAKRLKTIEVEKWEWKEEEPVYSRDRRLVFVNREKAVKDLVKFHKGNFYRAKLRYGPLWVIPLLDNVFGLGKSAFGQEYIRKCQSLKPDPTMVEFMNTLRSCHTIPIVLNHMHLLDDNGDFQSYKASRSLIECIRDFFKVDYGILPHTFDNLEENYENILRDLTEEVGPLFIVIDEIGLAFNHDKLDDFARGKQFIKFCELLQPLFENWKLFFLIVGRASFLDHVTRYSFGLGGRFLFERLDLHPLGRDAIKTIIKNTRWQKATIETIQDHLQLTEDQVTKAADHLFDTTLGHPGTLLRVFQACGSYDDLVTYTIPDAPIDGVE